MSTERYLNRDVEWLNFNARVLHEAMDPKNPLLERARFISIFQSNLDEYFMKRIGSLYSNIRKQFRERLLPLLGQLEYTLHCELIPELHKEGIEILKWKNLTDLEQKNLKSYFERQIFPILTPLSIDSGHPFPFLSNLSVSLGVLLKQSDSEEDLFARLKIPAHIPSLIPLQDQKKGKEFKFITLTDLIRAHLDLVFPGMEVLDTLLFRVTRNTNVERDEEDAEDLMELISEEIKERRFGDVVRLEHTINPNPKILNLLIDELHLDDDQIFEVQNGLELTGIKPLHDLNLPRFKFEPWNPIIPHSFSDPDRDLFHVIRNHDQLVHHPYESFQGTFERFLRASVYDPKVLAIKMTLYRVGMDNPIVPLLIKASELGKHVVVLVELKARFDEEKNLMIARRLEDAGVHVVYGVVGLKTHSKLTLVVRQEGNEVRSYAHIGTGNYHSITARLYTDYGLFTAREEITSEVVHLFHYLTGRSLKKDYQQLLVAPVIMKERFLKLIEREITWVKNGKSGRIIAKMNALDDREVIETLYAASSAGVQIELIVRGYCTLRPGVKGLSENINVYSLLGRFLEHSRVFYFQNGHENKPFKGDFYIGSADWMHRNLNSRVEAAVPIHEEVHRQRIYEFLQTCIQDRTQTWSMKGDGSYQKRKTKGDLKEQNGTHLLYQQRAKGRGYA